MALFIGIAWPVTVLAALYAGYRWGSAAKAKVIGTIDEAAGSLKDAVGKV